MIPQTSEHRDETRGEPGVGELFGQLAAETGTLIRQEVSLATLDVAGKGRDLAGAARVVGTGVLIALVGAQTLAVAAVAALAEELPLWLAALSVGGPLLLIGAIVIASGRAALARIELTPRKTIETLKENKAWAQQLVQ